MVLDKEAKPYAFDVLTQLRAYGYRSDMDMMNRSFKGQFKSVDRKHAKTAILIGNKEIEEGTATVKLLEKKEQVSVPIGDLIEFLDEHLVEEEEHHHHHHGEEE